MFNDAEFFSHQDDPAWRESMEETDIVFKDYKGSPLYKMALRKVLTKLSPRWDSKIKSWSFYLYISFKLEPI